MKISYLSYVTILSFIFFIFSNSYCVSPKDLISDANHKIESSDAKSVSDALNIYSKVNGVIDQTSGTFMQEVRDNLTRVLDKAKELSSDSQVKSKAVSVLKKANEKFTRIIQKQKKEIGKLEESYKTLKGLYEWLDLYASDFGYSYTKKSEEPEKKPVKKPAPKKPEKKKEEEKKDDRESEALRQKIKELESQITEITIHNRELESKLKEEREKLRKKIDAEKAKREPKKEGVEEGAKKEGVKEKEGEEVAEVLALLEQRDGEIAELEAKLHEADEALRSAAEKLKVLESSEFIPVKEVEEGLEGISTGVRTLDQNFMKLEDEIRRLCGEKPLEETKKETKKKLKRDMTIVRTVVKLKRGGEKRSKKVRVQEGEDIVGSPS
jgi:DNA repair exonuclease SbcCD ATPase subunit